MKVYKTKTELTKHLSSLASGNKTIGLVPTMGALHKGHASLINRAIRENDIVLVTIFVNPTQFNDPADLKSYPRSLEADLRMLQDLKVHLVFAPSTVEMYPEKDLRTFDLGVLDRVMEGAHREGHFNGVAQIVSKLFLLTNPARAYFGQKDFQQLVIVRRLAEILDLEISIIACPIIRETDGLAMSSRNLKLSDAHRKLAPFIHATLQCARQKKRELSPAEVTNWVVAQFEKQAEMHLEYFEIVEDKELRPILDWEEQVNKVGCLAVQLGGVRLIDNVIFD